MTVGGAHWVHRSVKDERTIVYEMGMVDITKLIDTMGRKISTGKTTDQKSRRKATSTRPWNRRVARRKRRKRTSITGKMTRAFLDPDVSPFLSFPSPCLKTCFTACIARASESRPLHDRCTSYMPNYPPRIADSQGKLLKFGISKHSEAWKRVLRS